MPLYLSTKGTLCRKIHYNLKEKEKALINVIENNASESLVQNFCIKKLQKEKLKNTITR